MKEYLAGAVAAFLLAAPVQGQEAEMPPPELVQNAENLAFCESFLSPVAEQPDLRRLCVAFSLNIDEKAIPEEGDPLTRFMANNFDWETYAETACELDPACTVLGP